MYTTNNTADHPVQGLVKGMQYQTPDNFESLVRDHGGRMLAVARRYLRSEADAQDCVQDAFIQAFRNIEKFEERSSIETWLHRIVVNTALMKIRASSRRPEEFIEDRDELFDINGARIEMEAEISVSVEDALVKEEVRRDIRNHIEQLPESVRNLLLLRDIEGYTTEEAADILGMTPGNVKIGLHRARKLLKNSLQSFSAQRSTDNLLEARHE